MTKNGVQPKMGIVALNRSFTIDYKEGTFLKDGKPFNYISGSIHYCRVPNFYWADRLEKMYAAGLDAIQVYIPWNYHEPTPGVYDFKGQRDLIGFLKLAQKIGLLVILRPGPYICAEWDFGGFPAWLLRQNSSVVVRTMDQGYIKPVNRWLNVLLPTIRPLLYVNGGPVIMVQVENEYGSYFACDKTYTTYLRDVFRAHLGNDVVLFTTDGNNLGDLKCGSIDGVYATVDFGTGNASAAFEPMRKWNPRGPLVNSEFYVGWLDLWGKPFERVPTSSIVKTLTQMLDMKANVNMYMFEGGTNFGFTNGAGAGEHSSLNVCPTTYDYDGPLSEAGDITDKYKAIRDVIGQYKQLPPVPIPSDTPKFAYGKVHMQMVSTVLNALHIIGLPNPVTATFPLSMEKIGQNYGFILYRTVLTKNHPRSVLEVNGIRDMGYVMLDGIMQGILDRNGATSLNLSGKKAERQTLDILVENQGRINYGSEINNNSKGIISNVTLGGKTLIDWQIYSLNFTKMYDRDMKLEPALKDRSELSFSHGKLSATPAIYGGYFKTPKTFSSPQDTYIQMDGWVKGQVYINNFNLGRYWPDKGPQRTLYVPSSCLVPYPGTNIVMMVELQRAPCQNAVFSENTKEYCLITFTDQPILNGTTLHQNSRHGQHFNVRTD